MIPDHAIELLRTAAERGIEFAAGPEGLRYRPVEAVDRDFAAALLPHKPLIMALITSVGGGPVSAESLALIARAHALFGVDRPNMPANPGNLPPTAAGSLAFAEQPASVSVVKPNGADKPHKPTQERLWPRSS